MSNRTKTQFLLMILLISLMIPQKTLCRKQGQARIDSMTAELTKNLSAVFRVELLNNLSYDYYSVNPDIGIKYGEQALWLAQKLKNRQQIGSSYNNIAINHSAKSNYAEALKYFFKSLEIAKSLKNIAGISAGLGNIAVIYDYQGDYKKAIEYYESALNMSNKLKNKRAVALNLTNIGNVYTNINQFKKALEYFSSALNIFEIQKDSAGISRCLGNKGKVYSSQNEFPLALDYFTKALLISENLGDTRGEGIYLGNIGETYFSQANEGLQNQGKNILPVNKIKLSLALKYFTEAVKKFEELGELYYLETYVNYISETYEQIGDNKNALKFYKEHSRIKDSVFSMESRKKITELVVKHDFDLKTSENKRQAEEKARLANERDNYTTAVQYTAISIFVILLLLGMIIFGKVISSVNLVDKLVFLIFLLTFEFITIVIEKPIGGITGGEPIFLLVTNTILALAITPLHSLLEHKIKLRIIKRKHEE